MIELSHVSKTYKVGDGTIYALNDLSLSIQSGELVAIVGKSGSGKSTLMNVLGCLDKPVSGTYSLLGHNVHRLSARERARLRREEIGFIFQGFNLLPRMTALENVAFPLMCAKVPIAQRMCLAKEALCKVGLGERLFHKPHEMSGGQQQRVAIARALVGSPNLILADEPTGNLDPKSSEEILDMLLEANSMGHTVVLITHDEKIARQARRRICISDGKIISDIIQ